MFVTNDSSNNFLVWENGVFRGADVKLLVTQTLLTSFNFTIYVAFSKQLARCPVDLGSFERLASRLEPCSLYDTNASRQC